VKLCFVHDYKGRFGVEPICAVLSEHGMTIAPGTYYKWLSCPVRPAELDEAYLVNEIIDLYRHNKCVYGVRKMWHAAKRAGLALGRDQVGRLMRIAGVQGVRRGAHHVATTIRDRGAARHPDLVKRAWKAPNRPDAIWAADFTYVWSACGFVYVSFITDVYSRRILGWKASMSKTTNTSAPLSRPGHNRSGIRPVTPDRPLEEQPVIWPGFPVGFRLPAFASWASFPARGFRRSLRLAYRAAETARTLSGFPCSARVRHGRGGCLLYSGAAVSSRPS